MNSLISEQSQDKNITSCLSLWVAMKKLISLAPFQCLIRDKITLISIQRRKVDINMRPSKGRAIAF